MNVYSISLNLLTKESLRIRTNLARENQLLSTQEDYLYEDFVTSPSLQKLSLGSTHQT